MFINWNYEIGSKIQFHAGQNLCCILLVETKTALPHIIVLLSCYVKYFTKNFRPIKNELKNANNLITLSVQPCSIRSNQSVLSTPRGTHLLSQSLTQYIKRFLSIQHIALSLFIATRKIDYMGLTIFLQY